MRVGIAGAGIMGQLMALALLEQNHEVVLIDRAQPSCSQAAAGMLSPVTELERNDVLIYEMGMTSLHVLWPQLLSRLPQEIYFRRAGSVLVAHSRDHAELTRCTRQLVSRLPDPSSLKLLAHTELVQLEPELDRFAHGYFLPQEGQIDNQHFLFVMLTHLQQMGVKYIVDEVIATAPHEIHLYHEKMTVDLVIDTRGLGCKQHFPDLRAVRGELIWLHAPQVNLSRPVRLMHPRYHLYVVPRPDNIYLLGASEIEAEDYSAISVQSTLELLTAAYYLHPGFAEARIIRAVTQCRPTLAHHLPQVKYDDGLIVINGLYRHGFLIAPAIAHEVMQFISQQHPLSFPQIWQEAA